MTRNFCYKIRIQWAWNFHQAGSFAFLNSASKFKYEFIFHVTNVKRQGARILAALWSLFLPCVLYNIPIKPITFNRSTFCNVIKSKKEPLLMSHLTNCWNYSDGMTRRNWNWKASMFASILLQEETETCSVKILSLIFLTENWW